MLAIFTGDSEEAKVYVGEYELFASSGEGSELNVKVRVVV